MFRQTIKVLKEKNWQVKIVIKTKDVLEELVKKSGFDYENILPQGRTNNQLAILWAVFKRDMRLWKIARKFKPEIMIGTDPSIAHVSRLIGATGITIVEDDASVIKSLVRMTYPFTRFILCPEVCNVGKYESKKLGYEGYMKLGYLHPNVFAPGKEVIKKYHLNKKFVLIRLSSLGAYHDYGIKGLTKELLKRIITKCEDAGYDIKLSAEFGIDAAFKKYLFKIDIVDMQYVLAEASLLICDSQSMTVEAAVLGTPSIRYSSFAGRISVLEELEKKYELTVGIPIGQDDYLFLKLEEYLKTPDLKSIFQLRRQKMLNEKIDVTAFLIWFIENYPSSAGKMKKDNSFQNRFVEQVYIAD